MEVTKWTNGAGREKKTTLNPEEKILRSATRNVDENDTKKKSSQSPKNNRNDLLDPWQSC